MPEQKKGKKILVIDDEEDTVIYLETLLQDNGYDTVSARMRFYKEVKSDPDLKSTPVVFVTGVTGYARDKDALRKFIGSRSSIPNPEGFFSKPIEREEFLKKIEEILG